MPDLSDVIRTALDAPETGWSMGSFGAIAEFRHVEGDPEAAAPGPLARVSDRGGVAFTDLGAVVPVACETLSPRADRWGRDRAWNAAAHADFQRLARA
ncbi:DUF6925 family protein [Pseudooceanicola sp. LIPI14-2-Ac024]|uniref:DUF6925 family protein n=1 Tax=Pseudooceanicola sp. LIPI14-2-Ac024 TaxID=3344875 RepID=UPI0035D0DF5B